MNEKRRRANALMMKYYSGMIDEGSWKTAAGDIAVFNTKYRRNLKSLVVQLEPVQAGSGDPSPDNVRPISGRTGATIYQNNGTTIPVSWETEAGTVYGGELNVVSGKLTVDRAIITYTGDTSENWINYSGYNGYYINNPNMKRGSRHNGICNRLKNSYTSAAGQSNAFWLGVGSQQIFVIGVYDSMGATREEFISYLSENPLQFVYPLDQSIEYQLTPQQIQTLIGENVIWSDAGPVSVEYWS